MQNYMNIKVGFSILALIALTSCKTPMVMSRIEPSQNFLITQDIKEDEVFAKTIAPYKAELESKMGAVLSHTKVELNKSGDNPNLGMLLSDFTYSAAKEWALKNNIPSVDAAVINIGGVRTILPAGDITVKNVYEVMPFENEIVIMKMKGSDLTGLFDYYALKQVNNPVTNFTIEVNKGVLTKKLINGKEVDPSKIYYIATSDYLALGGDYMSFFKKGELIATGLKMREAFLEQFKVNKEIVAPNETRLKFVK